MHRADGASAMAALLDSGARPDAVFAVTDQLALGALRVALARGLEVPGDLALVGFDDIEDGRFATPSLTTVSPDKAAIARRAVDCLVDRLDGGPDQRRRPARSVVVGHRLLVRESTTGRRAPRGR
jgi:DNA-binding LacI/PurR family transcriptional regulator